MEKLINLLNEYRPQADFIYKGGIRKEILWDKDVIMNKDLLIISKQFGFIKRLVDNDKINREQKTKEFRLQIEIDDGRYGELGGEDRVLMLLAISDNPIEELCKYLKDDATEKVDKLLDGAKRTCENIGI